jgi:hypothetical protein
VPCHSRRRSWPCGREARHVADRPDDPRGQYGTHAVDLGEDGAGGLHLGFDAPVQVLDLSVQRPDVAQHLRSQPPAEVGRGAALGPYAAQDARGPVGRERPGHPAGDEIPQKPVEAVERPCALRHQVLAPLGEQAQHLRFGLWIDRRQPLVARGGQRGGEGIDPVVLAGVAGREHPHPCRKLGRHVHHKLAGRRQPHRQVPTEATGVLHSPTALGEPFRPAFEAPQAGAVLREASTLDELAFGFGDRSDGDRRLVGIHPDEHLHKRTHLHFGRTSAIGSRKGHSDLEPCSHTSFESLRAPGTGGTQAENKPTRLTGDRKLASDPCNRRPRSLAAADHRAPDQS